MSDGPANRGWAYRIVWHEIDEGELNKYGQDGWELVTVLGDAAGSINRYLFKRAIT